MAGRIKPVEAVKEINVLIASPGDCEEYRLAMVTIIDFWNETAGKKEKIRFRPRMFERHSVATSGADGQTIINQQLVMESQACVAFFRSKVGYPTAEHVSGTVEEIATCAALGMKPGIHFWTGSKDDISEEGKRLAEYKKSIEHDPNKYYYQKFDTAVEAATKAMRSVLIQANELEGIDLSIIVDTEEPIQSEGVEDGLTFDAFYEFRLGIAERDAEELRKFKNRQTEGANKDLVLSIHELRSGWILTNETDMPITVHSYQLQSLVFGVMFMNVGQQVTTIEPRVIEPWESRDLETLEYEEESLRSGQLIIDYTIGNHRIEGTVSITLDYVIAK